MKCPQCQFENPADTRFCGKCGTQIKLLGDISDSQTKTAQTPSKEIDRGAVLASRYEIIELLGRGGMGNVYRVVDKKINEEIALKFLNPAIADEKMIERFKNELKLARKISHKNICRMYDLNDIEGAPYITMEYVAGEDLRNMIKMTGQLSVGRAISIAKQVCEGLAEAHRLGVVHRDLKPRNIMIDREGNSRIMDFGIARSIKVKGITKIGSIVGTPEYMSPEQVKGEKVDSRSDIYSLGIILFEMMTGQVPFEGDTSLSIALKHEKEIPPDPREFNAHIPKDLSRVILKCLEKDKERRFQGAGELFSDLTKIEEEIPTKEKVFARKIKTKVLKKRFRLLLPSILFTCVIFVLGYLVLVQIPRMGGLKWKNSIAVLPFKDLSQNKDQAAFCEEMTVAVISKLSSVKGLKVSPERSIRRYRETDKDSRTIGQELDIQTILEPYLKKEGERIHITAHLVDTDENFIIKSMEYDEEFEKIYEVQDRLSKDIAEALDMRLTDKQLEAVKIKETKNTRAYEFYVKGSHFEQRYSDFYRIKDFEAAVDNFEKAIGMDENYALAYWGLGNVYEARFVDENNPRDLDKMEEHFLKSYQIEPDLAEAHVGLGWVYFHKENPDRAFEYFKKAYEKDPDNLEINIHVGSFLRDMHLNQRAVELYLKAIEFDPASVDYREMCSRCYLKMGEFEKAAVIMKEALDLEPDDMRMRLFYARLLIMMQEFEKAEEIVDQVENRDPKNNDILYIRAWIFAIREEREKSLKVISKIEEPVFFSSLLSNVYSLLGMKDEAIQNIELAIEKGLEKVKTYTYHYRYLLKNPFYDNLRDDPRFQKIVKEQEEWYKENLRKFGDI
jgi:serine/threonine protein kinase/tetratricopeptide (TPR) repeat protein